MKTKTKYIGTEKGSIAIFVGDTYAEVQAMFKIKGGGYRKHNIVSVKKEKRRMNPYIELAKKSLSDTGSVTLTELKANKSAARTAMTAMTALRTSAACVAAYWAFLAALWAYWAAESDDLENTEYYKQKAIEAVKEYEELTR